MERGVGRTGRVGPRQPCLLGVRFCAAVRRRRTGLSPSSIEQPCAGMESALCRVGHGVGRGRVVRLVPFRRRHDGVGVFAVSGAPALGRDRSRNPDTCVAGSSSHGCHDGVGVGDRRAGLSAGRQLGAGRRLAGSVGREPVVGPRFCRLRRRGHGASCGCGRGAGCAGCVGAETAEASDSECKTAARAFTPAGGAWLPADSHRGHRLAVGEPVADVAHQ